MSYVVFNNIASGIANLCGCDVLNMQNVRIVFSHVLLFKKSSDRCYFLFLVFFTKANKGVTLTILSK